MLRQKVYPITELPSTLRLQILSSLRQTGPDGFVEEQQVLDWVAHQENHPVHLVLVQDSVLISHAEIVWKQLNYGDEIYKVYGLSGVFTLPAWRGRGYGRQIVAAATAYIRASDADLGLLWCAPELRAFYVRYGWQAMSRLQTLIGPPDKPLVYPLLAMMLFLSPKGRRDSLIFETGSMYFGENAW